MSTDTDGDGPPSALGRLLYCGILTYMSVDGFRNNGKRVDVAREKGFPLPDVMVPFATGMLLATNLALLFWKYPRTAAEAVIVFFLSTAPIIHNFWELEGEQRQGNKINFLKNVALLGGAIILLDEADS